MVNDQSDLKRFIGGDALYNDSFSIVVFVVDIRTILILDMINKMK